MSEAKPGHLLILTQVYPPDPTAVGQYLEDLAVECVRQGWTVSVYTSARGYDDPARRYPKRESLRGVAVRRFGLASFGKTRLLWRLLGQGIFVIRCLLRALFREPAGTRVVISTSPPFAGLAALVLKRVRGFRFGWWVMDINPDQSVQAGVLDGDHVFVRALEALNRATLRQAEAVVTLDGDMAERLRGKGAGADQLSVVPLWATRGLEVQEPPGTSAALEPLDLEGRLVVLYSGNHSLVHPLETLLEAALELRDCDRIRFIFSGGGAAKPKVEAFIDEHGLGGSVASLPYQPLESLQPLLQAGDLHVVAQGNAMTGCLHPSKFYSALACGKPVLWLGPETEASRWIEERQLGWQFGHGDTAGLARQLRALADDPRAQDKLAAMGERAASLSAEAFGRDGLLPGLARALSGGAFERS